MFHIPPISIHYLLEISSLIFFFLGDLELRIFKNIDEVYTPLREAVVEKPGANFSLICELKSSGHDDYDDQISWGRDTSFFR